MFKELFEYYDFLRCKICWSFPKVQVHNLKGCFWEWPCPLSKNQTLVTFRATFLSPESCFGSSIWVFIEWVVFICYYRNNFSLILCANQDSKVGKPSKMNKENSKAKWTGLSYPLFLTVFILCFKRWPHGEVTIYHLSQEELWGSSQYSWAMLRYHNSSNEFWRNSQMSIHIIPICSKSLNPDVIRKKPQR